MATYLDLAGQAGFWRSIQLNDAGTETRGAYGWRVVPITCILEIWQHWYGLFYPPETLTVTIVKDERTYYFECSTKSKADTEGTKKC